MTATGPEDHPSEPSSFATHTGRGGVDSPGIAAGRITAATPGGQYRCPRPAGPLSPPPLLPMLPRPERSEAPLRPRGARPTPPPMDRPVGAAVGAAGPPAARRPRETAMEGSHVGPGDAWTMTRACERRGPCPTGAIGPRGWVGQERGELEGAGSCPAFLPRRPARSGPASGNPRAAEPPSRSLTSSTPRSAWGAGAPIPGESPDRERMSPPALSRKRPRPAGRFPAGRGRL